MPKPIKVLFIEDDPDQIMIYETFLDRSGEIDVTCVRSIAEAWQYLEANPDVELLLVDILLNNENGLDFLAQVRANPKTKDLKAVVFTNFESNDTKKQAYDLGALDYIIKTTIMADKLGERIKKEWVVR